MESNATLRRWMIACVGTWLFISTLVGLWQWGHARSQYRASEENALRFTARRFAWNLSKCSLEELDNKLQDNLQGGSGLEATLEKNVSAGLLGDGAKDLPMRESDAPMVVEQGPIAWQFQAGSGYRIQVDILFKAEDGRFHSLRISRPAADASLWIWGALLPWAVLTISGAALLIYVLRVPNLPAIEVYQSLLKWADESSRQVKSHTGDVVANVALRLPDDFGELEDELNKSHAVSMQKAQVLYDEIFRTTRVLNSMLEGVVAVDRSLRILAANPAARDLLAMSAEPVPGRLLVELVRFPKLTSMVEQTLKSQRKLEGDVEVGSSNRRYLRIRLLPLPGDRGPIGVLITVSDETRLKRLEGMRRDFIANVSHELKTPLAAIKAYAETLLLGALEDQEKNVQFVERISQQAERLDGLIRDMLQLARVQSGNLPLNSQEFAVMPALKTCVESHRVIGEAKGVQVLLVSSDAESPGDRELIIRGDYEAFITIMNNVIGNAVRYTDAGGKVSVSVQASEPWVIVKVRDTGIGIASEDHERIFERFYRVDKARTPERGGTGLGLAIVKHLVKASGGEIRLQSELGVGSTFDVLFPGAFSGDRDSEP
jgi:two-component system phosphate regulon sensor histidine kinase PhoR